VIFRGVSELFDVFFRAFSRIPIVFDVIELILKNRGELFLWKFALGFVMIDV